MENDRLGDLRLHPRDRAEDILRVDDSLPEQVAGVLQNRLGADHRLLGVNPGRSGFEILRSLRSEKPALPVIVLTARGELEDRVAGLDAGAVDYLSKPFSLAELVARLRAQLRVVAQASTSTLRGADIELDLITRKVHRGERSIATSSA